MAQEILQPVAVLLLLNCVMWFWMYATRLPALSKIDYSPDSNAINGVQMSQLPPKVRWKADNYNHLLEQPVMFYAVCLSLAVVGSVDSLNVMFAWAYVGLRAVHSVVQSVWNNIPTRFLLHVVSTLVLVALIVRAAMVLFAQ